MPSFTSLSELKSEQEFSDITRSSSSNPIDAASLSAIWSTLSLLHDHAERGKLSFLPAHLTVAVSYPTKNPNPPSEALTFLDEFTRAAHVTSASLACSSILAGLSSESDEYGDVGLWLGPISFREDRERHVIDALGLENWLESGGKIVTHKVSSDALPSGLANIPQTQRDAAQDQLNALIPLIATLGHQFEFRLEGGQDHRGKIFWFFLGTLPFDKVQAWVGLVGAGNWGEEN